MDSTPFEKRSEDSVPPYEESWSSKPLNPCPPIPLPLVAQLADTRTQRINSMLSTYIDPLLMSQGAAGLYKTTFVLIPSVASAFQNSLSDVFTGRQLPQVMGFPSNETVKLVHLKGAEHSTEFWRQPAVIAELESSMKARLAASGYRLYEEPKASDTQHDLSPESIPDAPKVSAEPPKKSFWGRALFRGPDLTDAVIVDRKLGWRADGDQNEGPKGKVPPGLIRVTVVWKDISLRIENEVGLYESRRGPGLCITVEVGS